MAGRSSGINQAVTQDGGKYNKLQRPDDFMLAGSITAPPPRKTGALSAEASLAEKRKRTDEQSPYPYKAKRIDPNKKPATAHCRQTRPVSVRDCDTGMLPSMPIVSDDEGSSEDSTADALAYLRSVRNEASAIPHLLVAQTSIFDPCYEDEQHATSIVYEEGTWIAIDRQVSEHIDNGSFRVDGVDLSPQTVANKQLLWRFDVLREKLATAEPSPAKFDDRPETRFKFKHMFKDESPNMKDIRCLSSRAVLGRIKLCTEAFDDEGTSTISPHFSCWIWTLLALVGDIGTLDNPAVSQIRDLALAAGRMRARRSTEANRGPAADTSQHGPLHEHIHEHSMKELDVEADVADAPSEMELLEKDQKSTEHASQMHRKAAEDLDEGEMDDIASDVSGKPSESDAAMSLSGGESPVAGTSKDEDVVQARARLLAQLSDRLVQSDSTDDLYRKRPSLTAGANRDPAALNTKITIDMILTLVAERFGQRDLLGFREHW